MRVLFRKDSAMPRLCKSVFTVLLSLLCAIAAGTELRTDGDGRWVALWTRDGKYMSALSSDKAETWTKPKQSGTVPGNRIPGNPEDQMPVCDLLKVVVPEEWKLPIRKADSRDNTATCSDSASVEVGVTDDGRLISYFIRVLDKATGEARVKDIGHAFARPGLATDGKGCWLAAWADEDLRACYSKDDGLTWSGDIPLPVPDNLKRYCGPYEAKATITTGGLWCVVWDAGGFERGSDSPWTGPSAIWATVSRDKGNSWSNPVKLTQGIEYNSDSISRLSTIYANERLYAAWSQKVPDEKGIPPNTDIVMVSSADGLVWTLPKVINGNSRSHAGNNSNPKFYVGEGRRLLCAWDSTDTLGRTIDRSDHVFLAHSPDAGETWSSPIVLDANPAAANHTDTQAGLSGGPCVSTNSKGRWAVVWESVGACPEQFGLDADIMTCYSDDFGKTWSRPVPLNMDAATDYANDRRPQIAYDGNGRWITAWCCAPTELQGWQRSCRAAYSSDGRTWSKPVDLPLLDAQDWTITGMRLVALDNERWLVVYDRGYFNSSPFSVVCTRSEDGGKTWKAPMKLSGALNPDRPTGDCAVSPTVTKLSDGGCLVMWWEKTQSSGKEEKSILFQESYDGGATWNAPEKLPLDDACREMGHCAVTAGTKDNVLAVWTGPRCGVEKSEQMASLSTDNGRTWSPPQKLGDVSTQSTGAVATDGKGGYLSLLENYVSHGSRGDSDIEVKLCRSEDGKSCEPKLLSTITGTPGIYDTIPSLSTDGKGKWMAVYESSTWLKTWERDRDWASESSCRLIKSEDNGLTWSEPVLFPCPRKLNADKFSLNK